MKDSYPSLLNALPPKFEIITRPYKFIILMCWPYFLHYFSPQFFEKTESGKNGHKKLNNSYPNIPGWESKFLC